MLGQDTIETHAGGYLLRLDPEQIDAARFERLLREARAADGAQRTAELLRQALELVRGPAFADLADETFARPEAMRLDELRVAAVEERIEAELVSGARAELIGDLEALVAEHPLRERPRALLMRALYQSGRQADALAVYRDARRTLVDELGIEPGTELRDLERAILEQDPSLAAQPEHDDTTLTLPLPLTSLVGRERELDDVAALVLGDGERIVTLTGPGGIGKTRLAIALARRLAPAFDGSVAFVSLAAVTDPVLVVPAIAQALVVKVSGGLSPNAALVERLRERPTLLVVDNFEQLVSTGPLLADLVSAAPGLRVVVTSRTPVRVSGEHVYPVPPLEGSSAVQLFVERARAAVHGFDPDDAELDAVAGVCTRLDGLPLAIELAAARIQLLSPTALVARLGSLDVLGGRRARPARAAPDPARDDRLEPRPARGGRPAPVRAARGVRLRLDGGRGRDRLRNRAAARRARRARRQQPRPSQRRDRAALLDARDRPRLRTRAARAAAGRRRPARAATPPFSWRWRKRLS